MRTERTTINKVEQKWSHLKYRHVELEMHEKQLYVEHSQACTGESACLGAFLKGLFNNANNMELEENRG